MHKIFTAYKKTLGAKKLQHKKKTSVQRKYLAHHLFGAHYSFRANICWCLTFSGQKESGTIKFTMQKIGLIANLDICIPLLPLLLPAAAPGPGPGLKVSGL